VKGWTGFFWSWTETSGHGKESLRFISGGKFLQRLGHYQLLKEHFVPWLNERNVLSLLNNEESMHCWDILAVLRKQCIQNLLSKQGRSLNPITIKTLTKHSSYGLTDVKNCVLLLWHQRYTLQHKSGSMGLLTHTLCKRSISHCLSAGILLRFITIGHIKWLYLESSGAYWTMTVKMQTWCAMGKLLMYVFKICHFTNRSNSNWLLWRFIYITCTRNHKNMVTLNLFSVLSFHNSKW
jgi:hypothetical protein